MDSASPLLDTLVLFGASRGFPSNFVLRFFLATFFWGALAFLGLRQYRRYGEQPDWWLVLAAIFGLAPELWRFASELGTRTGLLDPDVLALIYAPFEHTLTMLAYVLIGVAFVRYFTDSPSRYGLFLYAHLGAIGALFLVTQPLWIHYLQRHPHITFEGFPVNFWLHVFRLWIVVMVSACLVHSRWKGARVPSLLFAGLGFFLVEDLLMVAHLCVLEVRPNAPHPVHHGMHIWGVPFLVASCWRDALRRSAMDHYLATPIAEPVPRLTVVRSAPAGAETDAPLRIPRADHHSPARHDVRRSSSMSRQQAAHRLKNMLTVIAGRSHTAMALADDNPELLAELQAINSTVQRSHTLLRNLFPVDKTPEEPLHPRKVHKEL